MRLLSLGVASVLALVACACGGRSSDYPTSPSQTTLSQSDVNRVTGTVAVSGTNAFIASTGATGSPTFRMPCPGGGTIDISAISGSSFGQPIVNGSVTMNEQMIFTNCVNNGVTLQSNPFLTLSSQFNVVGGMLVSPFVVSMTGDVKFSYNGVQGDVLYNCTSTYNLAGPIISSFTSTGSTTISYVGGASTTVPCSGA